MDNDLLTLVELYKKTINTLEEIIINQNKIIEFYKKTNEPNESNSFPGNKLGPSPITEKEAMEVISQIPKPIEHKSSCALSLEQVVKNGLPDSIECTCQEDNNINIGNII